MLTKDKILDNNIVVYENGEIEIKVSIDNQNETIWLTQKQIAEQRLLSLENDTRSVA